MSELQDGQAVAVLMAAGKSTRMKSDTPKVLHELCGQPILSHILRSLDEAGIHRKLIVVGWGAAEVRRRFAGVNGVEFVDQTEQRGTGHAVLCCEASLADHKGPVLVAAGDQPMLRPETVRAMLDRFRATGSSAFIASAIVRDPFGLGRILRDNAGDFLGIIEQKDATEAQSRICEINPSFYVFDGPLLLKALRSVRPQNAQGEYYLTDVPAILRSWGLRVVAEPLADETDMLGINHRGHLASAHSAMQSRIQIKLLDSGVTIVDPSNTYIDARAVIGRDTVIFPFTVIQGAVQIGARCKIGPFAHLREDSILGDDVQVGAFVEVVRSRIGSLSVAKHLSYLGDATLGAGVNVGAGVITANFDDGKKSSTVVGDNAFLGSGSVLVAPVAIGDGAVVGAGAVLPKNHDVLAGELVVGVPARPMKRPGH